MCQEHTREELANILDTLADLFTWKRRARLAEAAAMLRAPSREWRHPAAPDVPADKPFVGEGIVLASNVTRSGTRPA